MENKGRFFNADRNGLTAVEGLEFGELGEYYGLQ